MKVLYNIGLIIALFACSISSFSQNQNLQRGTRQRPSEVAPSDKTPILTERAKIKSEESSKASAHVVWSREMYRVIDLEKENNAALYYPVQPVGDRMNLFAAIFKLIADGKITAYNYVFGRQEVFTNDQIIDFEEILKKFQIIYNKQGSGDNVRYIVDDRDIPSDEVLEYQIKEGWYFDAATGTNKSQVIAICPLLVRMDYSIGNITRTAMCWIPYESLRPYLSRIMIMTSDYNNVMSYSIDDFFTKGMYQGDIIKTVNMRDQSLAQQVGNDPEQLKLAQDSIENQLKTFREQLWVKQDTTQVAVKGTKKSNVKNEPAPKKEKAPKAPKPEKSSASSSSTKSVRRTR